MKCLESCMLILYAYYGEEESRGCRRRRYKTKEREKVAQLVATWLDINIIREEGQHGWLLRMYPKQVLKTRRNKTQTEYTGIRCRRQTKYDRLKTQVWHAIPIGCREGKRNMVEEKVWNKTGMIVEQTKKLRRLDVLE